MFEEKNTEIIALVVEPQDRVAAIVAAYGYPYPILADADHTASSDYGIYNLFNDSRAAPSVFIVDETGLVTWAYVGQDISDRPSAQQILDQLP
jgi:peroxiredoxin